VTGRAKPNNEVYAVVIYDSYYVLISVQPAD
jgi:hypothetical protein